MDRIAQLRRWPAIAAAALLLGVLAGRAQGVEGIPPATFTNLAQLHPLTTNREATLCSVQFKGVVLWVSAARDEFIFQDDSAGATIRMDVEGRPDIDPGIWIELAGDCLAGRDGQISECVVNDNGVHSATEISGTCLLPPGGHPLTIEWFNNQGDFALDVDWGGPGMPRQRLMGPALYHIENGRQPLPGLEYRVYEGGWSQLPDFSKLTAIKQGVATNLTTDMRTRNNEVGVVFSGGLQIERPGLYTFWVNSDDGCKLYLGRRLKLTALGKTEMPPPHECLSNRIGCEDFESRWVEVEGTVNEVRKVFQGVEVEVLLGAEHIYLKASENDYESLRKFSHGRVRADGIYQSARGLDGQTVPTLLLSSFKNVRRIDPGANHPTTNDASGLPTLTTALQVKGLSREEAQRGYPVKIRGVITGRGDHTFVIQDATWSIFCYADNFKESPRIGEVWEIEGNSDVQFAPDIVVRNASYLGPGILPEPIRPTKEELINGSLDTQYIAIQGIVTAMDTNGIRLLTREGELQFAPLDEVRSQELKDALIRISGVYIPNRDTNLMLLPSLSPIQLFNASVSVDAPPPRDLFDLPLKRISDLLQFDARADALRRVKIAGQILLERQGEYFLNDGTNGARFESREPVPLNSGQWVEVAGFPDLSGPSPVLHEASARLTRITPLPPALPLSPAAPANNKLDGTLVTFESRLLDVSKSHAEETFELKFGTHNYLARLAVPEAGQLDIAPGSLVRLTGVYAVQANKLNPGNEHSFELLLISPSDLLVLARPSWWTTRHALMVVGGMLFVILGALIWIALLHRQVEERTYQLASEIKGREQAESQRALETERTRIAQDLHDELGAALTEIRFLGAVKSRGSAATEDMRSHLKEISDKSHQMVSSLDEIVWAINPANDSLPNLANYLCYVTEEFFRLTEIRCRLDVDEEFPALFLTSEVRHALYLVVREALNNVAKHSGGSEVWLRIHCRDKTLRIIVEDNGCGFTQGTTFPTGNGLNIMRSRIEKIGGRFECESEPGRGTRCRIHLQLS